MAGRRPQWGLPGSRHEQGGLLLGEKHLSPSPGESLSHALETGALFPLTRLLRAPSPPPCCVSFAARLAQAALPKSQNVPGGLLPSNPIPPSGGSCLPSRIGLTTSLAPPQSPCPLQSCPEDQMIPPG